MAKLLRDIPTQELWPWLLIAAGAVALGVVLLLISLLIRTRRGRDPLSRKSSAPITLSQERAVERDMTDLMEELSSMARQIGKQLDSRAARLEELLRAADERIHQLEQLERDRSVVTPIDDRALPPLRATPFDALKDEPDPRHLEIYRLADKGMDTQEIAHELRRPKGEIELILALRPRKTG